MKKHKVAGPDEIDVEPLKCGDRILKLKILHLSNECWKQKKSKT